MPNQANFHAKEIWNFAVDAVNGARLLENRVSVASDVIEIFGLEKSLKIARDQIDQICIVGAGKASAAMAVGLESQLLTCISPHQIRGLINTTNEQVARYQSQLRAIQLQGVRSTGANFANQQAVEATQQIVELVQHTQTNELCFVLLSGGGSAMLTSPIPPVTVNDKSLLAQQMFSAGANIQQVNQVRQQLSQVKGGKLLQACHSERLISLIVSDVIGNPIELIASGPTMNVEPDHQNAISILEELHLWEHAPDSIRSVLLSSPEPMSSNNHGEHLILADNSTAVQAAASRATQLGYQTETLYPSGTQPTATQLGEQLAHRLHVLLRSGNCQRYCLVMGSESTVRLPSNPGLGGRNQHVVLTALANLDQELIKQSNCEFSILSGGTDGEDGPTNCAGASIDNETSIKAFQRDDLHLSLKSCDSNSFLSSLGCLLKTGQTGTNVCDLQVLAFVQKPAID